MQRVTPDSLLEGLRWRYAVKRFDPDRKVPAATWKALEQSLVLAPSSFGLQPWRFVVVEDPKKREELLPASWGQRQVVDASHLVVFAAKTAVGPEEVDRFLRRTAEVRRVPVESLAGFRDMLLGFAEKLGDDAPAWTARQTYIALGVFLTSAALLGVDACPMEGIDPDRYDAILGLGEEGYHALAVATAGYRAADDKYASLVKVRFEDREVLRRV